MSTFAYETCADDEIIHDCDPCDDGEGSNVRGVILFKDGAVSNFASSDQWGAAILAKTAIVIPETRGTFDGGTPVYGKGFGDRDKSFEGADYKLVYTDPNYIQNNSFYSKLQNQAVWNVAWRSETQIHVSGKKCTFFAKDPHTDENKNKIYWECEVSWSSKDKPTLATIPSGIFACGHLT